MGFLHLLLGDRLVQRGQEALQGHRRRLRTTLNELCESCTIFINTISYYGLSIAYLYKEGMGQERQLSERSPTQTSALSDNEGHNYQSRLVLTC